MAKISEYQMINQTMVLITREMSPEEQKALLPRTTDIKVSPTQLDKIEAQVLYTALMTDTLIEEG